MSVNVKEVLESLGYKLDDRGKYWQTNAMFRDGDNRTAIQIYKDTGVWKDHVQDTKFMKFEVLVKKTLGTNNKDAMGSNKRWDIATTVLDWVSVFVTLVATGSIYSCASSATVN